MGSRFSLFNNEDVDMSPVLRKRNEYADIDAMSAAAVKKELKQHGLEVDALLREKLKELRQTEVSAAARRSGTTPMDTEAATAPVSSPLALPVPIVQPKADGPLTRSQLTESAMAKRRARKTPAVRKTTMKRKTPATKKMATKSVRKRSGQRRVRSGAKRNRTQSGKAPAAEGYDEENDETDYDVEMIMDIRLDEKSGKAKRQFLIRWTGYGVEDDQWIDETMLALPIDEYKHSDVVKTKLQADDVTGSI